MRSDQQVKYGRSNLTNTVIIMPDSIYLRYVLHIRFIGRRARSDQSKTNMTSGYIEWTSPQAYVEPKYQII
jgi:hypothetical protein